MHEQLVDRIMQSCFWGQRLWGHEASVSFGAEAGVQGRKAVRGAQHLPHFARTLAHQLTAPTDTQASMGACSSSSPLLLQVAGAPTTSHLWAQN